MVGGQNEEERRDREMRGKCGDTQREREKRRESMNREYRKCRWKKAERKKQVGLKECKNGRCVFERNEMDEISRRRMGEKETN